MANLEEALQSMEEMFATAMVCDGKPNPRYAKEIVKLASYLDENLIEYTLLQKLDGYQLITDDWDVVCFTGSYGGKLGLLEAMGVIVDSEEVGDDVEGYLTAEDIMDRIENL